jgi:hypothetical protein
MLKEQVLSHIADYKTSPRILLLCIQMDRLGKDLTSESKEVFVERLTWRSICMAPKKSMIAPSISSSCFYALDS